LVSNTLKDQFFNKLLLARVLMRSLVLLLTVFCTISAESSNLESRLFWKTRFTDEIFPRTDPEVMGLIYQMLKVIDVLFTEHGISYWIDGGTALGALRHQGCIPWDDDADLVFHIEDQERILSLKDEFAAYGFYLRQDNIIRLFPSEEKQYPYIDLAGYVLCDDNIYRFDLLSARMQSYHSFYWLPQEVESLVRVPFGTLMLNAPNDMIRYVFTGYGKDCLTHAIFKKHHGGTVNLEIREKVRIVDFSPAKYKITNFNVLLD
jgi:hypothetical protein